MPSIKKVNIADIEAKPEQTYWEYFINVSDKLLEAYKDDKNEVKALLKLIDSNRVTDVESIRTRVFATPAQNDEQISDRILSVFRVARLKEQGENFKNMLANPSTIVDVKDLIRLFDKRIDVEEEMVSQADEFRQQLANFSSKIKRLGSSKKPLTNDERTAPIAKHFFENLITSYETPIAKAITIITSRIITLQGCYMKLIESLELNNTSMIYENVSDCKTTKDDIVYYFAEHKVQSKGGARDLFTGLNLPYDVNQFILDWIKQKCAQELGSVSIRTKKKETNPSVLTRMYDNAIHLLIEDKNSFSQRMSSRKDVIRACIKKISDANNIEGVHQALIELNDSNNSKVNGYSKALVAKLHGHNGIFSRIEKITTAQADLITHNSGPRLPRHVK